MADRDPEGQAGGREDAAAGPGDIVRLLARVDLRLCLLAEPRPSAPITTATISRPAGVGRSAPTIATTPAARAAAATCVDRRIDRLRAHVRHGARLDAVPGQARLRQAHDGGAPPAGLLHRGDRRRHRLGERRRERRRGDRDPHRRHRHCLPGTRPSRAPASRRPGTRRSRGPTRAARRGRPRSSCASPCARARARRARRRAPTSAPWCGGAAARRSRSRGSPCRCGSSRRASRRSRRGSPGSRPRRSSTRPRPASRSRAARRTRPRGRGR